jgi:hypothetical protein
VLAAARHRSDPHRHDRTAVPSACGFSIHLNLFSPGPRPEVGVEGAARRCEGEITRSALLAHRNQGSAWQGCW